MSNESGYVTLEGVELRKATLKAAGWGEYAHKLSDGATTYQVVNPDGGSGYGYTTSIDAWTHTPAVESSVDAALEYLTLDEGHYWVNQGPYKGMWWARIDKPNYPIALAGVDNPSLAVAMCRAYLQYKGGAW